MLFETVVKFLFQHSTFEITQLYENRSSIDQCFSNFLSWVAGLLFPSVPWTGAPFRTPVPGTVGGPKQDYYRYMEKRRVRGDLTEACEF